MFELGDLLKLFSQDPILGYSLLAALFLLLVSLTAGLTRLDFLALSHPTPLLACLACLVLAVLLRWLQGVTPLGEGSGLLASLAGVERFPLTLAALAYGPTVALALAALYAISAPTQPALALSAVLALELALAGWLAIYPSPRQFRWAGPFNALLAYALVWATGGLALAAWQVGDVRWQNLLTLHPGDWSAALAASLLLFMFPPAAYRRAFPHSRIVEEEPDEDVVITPLVGTRERPPRVLDSAAAPGELWRKRGRREGPKSFG